eukprot:m.64243 g.64243  ORF g.64243 m.64243 type:complete len:453 (+) comp35232_c0_seq1:1718-3076(+)
MNKLFLFLLAFVPAAATAASFQGDRADVGSTESSGAETIDTPIHRHGKHRHIQAQLIAELQEFVAVAEPIINNTILLGQAIDAWLEVAIQHRDTNYYYSSTSASGPPDSAGARSSKRRQNCPVDRYMNRALILDYCGVCGGRNLTCKVVVNRLRPKATNSLGSAYRSFKIPSMSKHIVVQKESTNADSRLVLLAKNGDVVVNGSLVTAVDKETTVKFHRSRITYVRRKDGSERITCSDLISKSLQLRVVHEHQQRKSQLPLITITRIEERAEKKAKLFTWVTGGWTKCNAKGCNAGIQSRYVACMREHSWKARPDALCRKVGEKPTRFQGCHKCSGSGGRQPETSGAQWVPGKWQECSHTCGWQTREVSCYLLKRANRHEVGANYCSGQVAPERKRRCPTSQTDPACKGLLDDGEICVDRVSTNTCLLLTHAPTFGCSSPRGQEFCCHFCKK